MGKRKRRAPRSAYLKKHKRLYDPYSDYALRTRGQKVIDLASPIPISLMVSAERENVRLKWQSLRLQNLTDYHRVIRVDERRYKLSKFFSGRQFFWIEEDERKNIRRRSKKYATSEAAEWAYDNDAIIWAEYEPINSVPPPA